MTPRGYKADLLACLFDLRPVNRKRQILLTGSRQRFTNKLMPTKGSQRSFATMRRAQQFVPRGAVVNRDNEAALQQKRSSRKEDLSFQINLSYLTFDQAQIISLTVIRYHWIQVTINPNKIALM